MDILSKLLIPFVALPWLTPVPALAFAWVWFTRARGGPATVPVGVAAVVWIAYCIWEISFAVVPVREWIRVDLLVIGPALLAATLWAIVALLRRRR